MQLKSLLPHFPSCDSLLWGQMNNQNWCKGERLQEGRENQILHFQYPFDQFTCNTKLHFISISLSSYTSARLLHRYVMFKMWRASYFHVSHYTQAHCCCACWQKVTLKECTVSPQLWTRKKSNESEDRKKSQLLGIGRQLGLKIDCQMYCSVPSEWPLGKAWSGKAGHEFIVSFVHERTFHFGREKRLRCQVSSPDF